MIDPQYPPTAPPATETVLLPQTPPAQLRDNVLPQTGLDVALLLLIAVCAIVGGLLLYKAVGAWRADRRDLRPATPPMRVASFHWPKPGSGEVGRVEIDR